MQERGREEESPISYLDDLILDIDEGERSRVVVLSDGREQYQSKITLTEKGFEALRQGYLCGRCLEDLRPVGAFPEECPTCHFPVRAMQMEQLQRDFVGSEVLGSKISLSDELARMSELWLPGS